MGVERRLRWNGVDIGRFKGSRTTKEKKRGKGQNRDPIRLFPPEHSLNKSSKKRVSKGLNTKNKWAVRG